MLPLWVCSSCLYVLISQIAGSYSFRDNPCCEIGVLVKKYQFFCSLHMLRLKKNEEKKAVESPVDMNPSEQSQHQDDSAAGRGRRLRIER